MKVRDWYLKEFPTDSLGVKIREDLEFSDFRSYEKYKEALLAKAIPLDVYLFIGVRDSVIRERVFEKLAEIEGVSYEKIYKDIFLI